MSSAGSSCPNNINVSIFSGSNLIAAVFFSIFIAALVVIFTQLVRPKVESSPRVEHSPCKQCELSTLSPVARDFDPREYKLQKGSFTPSDVSVRSKVWHHHPTWHIPSLEREKIQVFSGIDDVLKILDRFDVSPHR